MRFFLETDATGRRKAAVSIAVVLLYCGTVLAGGGFCQVNGIGTSGFVLGLPARVSIGADDLLPDGKRS